MLVTPLYISIINKTSINNNLKEDARVNSINEESIPHGGEVATI